MKILLVDDEKEQLQALSVGLRSNGFKVLEYLNAEEALEYLNNENRKVNIIITDYSMPGMNGMELLKKIRENNTSFPVIMMTAFGEKELVIEALRNRCDGFIEKPFTLQQLILEIQRIELQLFKDTDSHQLPEFIQNFVHQLNNPLTAIMGSAQLSVLDVDDTESIKKYMAHIVKAVKKIQEINREMLDHDRANGDEIETIAVRKLVGDCLNMFQNLMALKGVSLEKDLNGGNLYVSGNSFGLEQAFKNLILNAIDSMDGRPEKRLRIRVEEDGTSSSILVSIQDTGCGIPKKIVDKIFTSYFTTKKNGTGLGLPVVKGVVEKHKGKIKVESQLGKGTIFTVWLPISAA